MTTLPAESALAGGYEALATGDRARARDAFAAAVSSADTPEPYFVGLPDDRCQCPHWGYVIAGKVSFAFGDGRSETYETGDAYYAPPGHTPTIFAGTELVEFHPTEDLAKTVEVVTRNMEAASA